LRRDTPVWSGAMHRDAYAPPPPPRPQPLSRRELLRLRLNRSDVDYEGYARLVREEWEGVDRGPLLRALEPVAETLTELAGARAADRVLDASDPAATLPHPDDSFDVVLSAFGFALAPRPLRTARELVRGCGPGGTVALAAWTPRGLPGGLDEYSDRPPGIPSPALWGHEPRVRERLTGLLDDLVVRTRTVRLEFPSPDALFEQLAPPRRAQALRPAFDRLLAASNDRPPAAVVSARHLLITGTRRA
jgi:SAM-dependent methyltransferase